MQVMGRRFTEEHRQIALLGLRLQGQLADALRARDAADDDERPFCEGVCNQLRAHANLTVQLQHPGPLRTLVPVHSGVHHLTSLFATTHPLTGLGTDPTADLVSLEQHLRGRIADAQYLVDLHEETLEYVQASYARAGVRDLDPARHRMWLRSRGKLVYLRDRCADLRGAYEDFGQAASDLSLRWRRQALAYQSKRLAAIVDDTLVAPERPDVSADWQTFLMLHTPHE